MSQGAGTAGTPSALQNGFNKVFIQRDYSEGTAVKFHTRLPSELEGLVSFLFYHLLHIQNTALKSYKSLQYNIVIISACSA